jgi:dihydroflavonol-4-reductase
LEIAMADTVLVTGGTGYVARECIAHLLENGYKVRTTVRDEGKQAALRKVLDSDGEFGGRLEFAVADLLSDNGWDAAVTGCRHVLHVASPLGANSATAEQIIETAVGGTLRVLAAAVRNGVERVVMTSAANASSPVSYEEEGITDETLWTDPDAPGLIPYRRSKTLAERAAWDFIAREGGATSLTTILPGAVFGPARSPDNLVSVQVIGRMLRGEMPGIPRIGFEIVDVRDLADIHLRAMVAPQAAGERFLATGEFLWMAEIAETLRLHCGEAAEKLPTLVLPDEQVRKLAEIQPGMREIAIALGRKNRHSTAKAKTILGWTPRPARDTVTDCGRSLISWGLV